MTILPTRSRGPAKLRNTTVSRIHGGADRRSQAKRLKTIATKRIKTFAAKVQYTYCHNPYSLKFLAAAAELIKFDEVIFASAGGK